MTVSTRVWADGTSVTQQFPFGIYLQAEVRCSDGKIRKTKRISSTADTFFSVPCSVRVKGKTVTGFMTMRDTLDGNGELNIVAAFVSNKYGKNGALLP